MPSLSEPPTPVHDIDYLGTQLEASSCDDFLSVKPYGRSKILASARYNCLKKKREEIARFLRDHEGENLDDYIGLVLDQYRARIWPILARKLVTSHEEDDDDCDTISSVSDSNSLVSTSTHDSRDTDDEQELRSHPEWNQVRLFSLSFCLSGKIYTSIDIPVYFLSVKIFTFIVFYLQVDLDVRRTLARFPPNISDDHRTTLQDQLTPLIVRVLRSNSRFRYYQGFHDVCLTVILVCGVESAYEVCKNLAHHGPFRSYLTKSLESSVLKELELLYVILSRADPELERVLREVHLGTMFALSWPLTWFSHSLNKYQQIVRFFDVFLASPPLTPIYVCAAIVLKRKSAILTCDREMPIIHQLLSTMPNELHLDAILSDSLYLSSLMPPFALKTEFSRLYRERVRPTSTLFLT
ncbi:unnamed protein product [Nippostrongylus brasiliensis]|uniref:Rab-GAP TBC domain-containing protein n=1 Tax=Nippostrongylus brasiliensis TaxID=27835 RepID=A0A0N4YH23_NIPBR|nr:unnamed protein product [Nippostrongylus brasiliensis]